MRCGGCGDQYRPFGGHPRPRQHCRDQGGRTGNATYGDVRRWWYPNTHRLGWHDSGGRARHDGFPGDGERRRSQGDGYHRYGKARRREGWHSHTRSNNNCRGTRPFYLDEVSYLDDRREQRDFELHYCPEQHGRCRCCWSDPL